MTTGDSFAVTIPGTNARAAHGDGGIVDGAHAGCQGAVTDGQTGGGRGLRIESEGVVKEKSPTRRNLRPKRDVLIGFVDGNGLAPSRRSPGRIARLKSRDGAVTSTPHGDRGAADGAHVRWRGAVTDRQTG